VVASAAQAGTCDGAACQFDSGVRGCWPRKRLRELGALVVAGCKGLRIKALQNYSFGRPQEVRVVRGLQK